MDDLPPQPPLHVRRESVSWPADDPPSPSDYHHTSSYGSFPPAIVIGDAASHFASSSSSSAAAYFAHSPRTDRRLRWRAVLFSVSTIAGFAALVMVVILMAGRGNTSGLDGGGMDDGYDAPRRARRSRHHRMAADDDVRPFLLGAQAPADSPLLATPPPLPPDPSPPYPSSAPQDPNIKIPFSMGCMEAQCESYMAAMGKGHADPANPVLLDCIQRTGMSSTATRACFAASNVTASPLRVGLYTCAVCKGCVTPKDAKEKAALCPTSSSTSSSSSSAAPSASNWSQYVPQYRRRD